MDQQLEAFISNWTEDSNGIKPLFTSIYEMLDSTEGVSLDYKGRPGISHSLRAKHVNQKRELFVLVDVIDDEPESRWLSVCFYADLVTDPEEMGDVVPAGLMGEDACCFDVDSMDSGAYLLERIREAAQNAAKEGA